MSIIKGVIKPTNSKEIPMTLELTMPIAEWSDLNKQLNNTYPSWRISQMISELVNKAIKNFESEIEYEDGEYTIIENANEKS